ncbi:winged helix-turn-helix transcriptional regulator [Actinomadura parmotrematis]|uniref:Helix-turn-helix transcriptional regulator n=1 Tax=Actinomadura parmotrematis TaxID=2864039 RepID=A0ABS7FS05_9ACTN|nr:helix-turn-helix domain-containing protein [Actinomadura parmotrematis]MBW8483194.1 helix-turn-helix transcriptional regulator [Actinomadura parmotrematis]
MALGKDYSGQNCSLARALEIVGERWTLLILRDVFFGVRRFSDFQIHLDVPRAVLSARLAALVRDGVLSKEGQEYAVTPMGRGLWPVIHLLSRWGADNFSDAGPCRLFFHAACAARIDSEGACTACGAHPAVEDWEIRPGPGMDAEWRDDPITRALSEPHRLLDPVRP